MVAHIGDGDRRDFDETRRLLYMATLVGRTKRYNLAGTLVNALLHHHSVDGLSATEVTEHVVNVIEDTDPDGSSMNWVHDQIGRISDELDD